MADQVIYIRYEFRRGVSADWTSTNPILRAGEPGIETDTSKMKIGNGVSTWTALEYFLPASDIQAMIDASITEAGGGDSSDPTSLNAHINSATPHPVYDNDSDAGESLTLLYENAKV